MVPQLDTAFYISQLFWLITCLLILVFFFKRFFLPKISELTMSRERYVNNLKSEVHNLEQQIQDLLNDLESIKRKQTVEINNINNQAKEQCLKLFEQHKADMEKQHLEILAKLQYDANETVQNLSKTLNAQINHVALEIFNKLFA